MTIAGKASPARAPASGALPAADEALARRLHGALGRAGPGFVAFAVLLLALVALGAWGYAQQRMHGDIVTGLRTIGQGGAAWGLYIAFDVFFVGLAFGGIAFTTLVRLFRLHDLRPLSRVAQVMTLVSLVLAGLCVVADLGRPLQGLLNFPRYARVMSPFFGTFTLVACTGSLATFVYLWLDGRADAAWCAARSGDGRPLARLHRAWAFGFRGSAAERWRHQQTSFYLALALLPLLLVAYSTLGFVFGIQGGRPGWYGALQAPGFVVLAGVSSVGMLIVAAAAVRRFLHLEDAIGPSAFRWLANALWLLTGVYLYILAVEELTAFYAASAADTAVARAVVLGPYAPTFWSAVAAFVAGEALLFGQFLARRRSIGVTVVAALLVNVGAALKRTLIIVPSQTHGTLLPYPAGSYQPTWVEYAFLTGLLALGILLFALFAKLFPIVPFDTAVGGPPAPAEREPARARVLRVALSWATLLVGLGTATVGFLACARVGIEPWMDPEIAFAPVVFVAGLVLVFYSAAVYEAWPSARTRARSDAAVDAGSATG